MRKLTKKQAMAVFHNWSNSNRYNLSDVYNTYSDEKRRAEYMIQLEMVDAGGSNYRIIGANCNTFSCAYIINSTNTLIYHTSHNKYIINLDDIFNF